MLNLLAILIVSGFIVSTLDITIITIVGYVFTYLFIGGIISYIFGEDVKDDETKQQ